MLNPVGELNNCINCGASYSKYGGENDAEFWCEVPEYDKEATKKTGKVVFKKRKGLCQFCNKKTRYYIEKKYE